MRLGWTVGASVGTLDGEAVGIFEGMSVGSGVGMSVGFTVGAGDGKRTARYLLRTLTSPSLQLTALATLAAGEQGTGGAPAQPRGRHNP